MMISLKQYLGSSAEDSARKQALSLVLEKIASQAAVAKQSDYRLFSAEINRLRECIDAESEPGTLLFLIGSVTQLIETYNREITTVIRRQAHEAQDMFNMMTETITTLSGENVRAATAFGEFGQRFEAATGIDDIDELKQHLGEALRDFRTEMLRQKNDSDRLLLMLRQEIEKGSPPSVVASIPSAPSIDPTTSLRLRQACVGAMHLPVPPGKRRYVVTFVINCLKGINARYGFEVGDRVLRRFAQFVKEQIASEDSLYRWNGPSFVAVLERSETLDQIRRKIECIMRAELDETFDLEGRSLLVPISAAWSAFQLISTVATAEKQIETFATACGGND
jgi:diguanylate cyclase (GGDEF)-like protein